MSAFINGLRDDIRSMVRMMKSANLYQSFEVVRLLEQLFENSKKPRPLTSLIPIQILPEILTKHSSFANSYPNTNKTTQFNSAKHIHTHLNRLSHTLHPCINLPVPTLNHKVTGTPVTAQQ